MTFDMNPADEDPHGECRHEIERLTGTNKTLLAACELFLRFDAENCQAGTIHYDQVKAAIQAAVAEAKAAADETDPPRQWSRKSGNFPDGERSGKIQARAKANADASDLWPHDVPPVGEAD